MSYSREEQLYELLGIRFFKKWMPTSGDMMMRYVFRSKHLENGRTNTLSEYADHSIPFDVVHLFCFAIWVAISLYAILFSDGKLDIATGVANILINVYPIML